MWIVFAGLSAVFAALTSILAKIGIENVSSNLATAIRTAVVLILSWGIVFISGKHLEIPNITVKSWVFLALSGVATGLSWLCYYYALQNGPTAKVITIDKFSLIITMVLAMLFLKEGMGAKDIIGAVLVTAGTILIAM
jgi:transporter family protein